MAVLQGVLCSVYERCNAWPEVLHLPRWGLKVVLLCSAVICAVICQFPVVTSSGNRGSTVFHWIASEKMEKYQDYLKNTFKTTLDVSVTPDFWKGKVLAMAVGLQDPLRCGSFIGVGEVWFSWESCKWRQGQLISQPVDGDLWNVLFLCIVLCFLLVFNTHIVTNLIKSPIYTSIFFFPNVPVRVYILFCLSTKFTYKKNLVS